MENRMDTRPLKRSADTALAPVPAPAPVPNAKRTAPENVPIKSQAESTDSKPQGQSSNSSRREELLRELKAVEDAIARKRARIE